MLRGQPYLTARIEAEHVLFEVHVNGGFVSTDITGSPASETVPINQFLRSGVNQMSVLVYPFEQDDGSFKFDAGARLTLTIIAREAGDRADAASFALCSIAFNGADAGTPAAIKASSAAGFLDSSRDFAVVSTGDVRLGPVQIEQARTDGIVVLSRELDLRLPFPEWRFLSSDAEEPTYSLEEAELTSRYNALFAAYEEIWRAMNARDLGKLLPMFEERSQEIDAAFYLPPGSTQARLKEGFESAFKDRGAKLAPIRTGDGFWHYDVGPGGRLMRLSRGDQGSAILRFTLQSDDYSRVFPVSFRRKNGRYIVAR